MLEHRTFNVFCSVVFLSLPFSTAAGEDSKLTDATSVPSQSASLEAIIDPVTGELISKLPQTSTNATPNNDTADNKLKQQNVVMTKMSNGATKIDFNGRFLRPLNVSVDAHGNIISHGHTMPKEVEADQ